MLGREQVDSSSSPPSQPHPSSETEAQKPTTDSSFFFSDDEEGEEPKEGDLDLAASQSTPSNVPIRGTIHTGSSGRYLAQKYTSGTLCDLTKQPREIEIQYHCPTSSSVAGLTNPRIAHVKEVTTCNYQMLVYVPQLCEDRAFRKVKEGSALEIRCRRIVDSDDALEAEASVDEDEEVDDEEREKVRARQSATEELKEVLASAPVQRPIAIGGTIIGGNRYFAPNTEGKPFLAPPKKWVSSTHPPPEAGKLDAAAAAAISYSEEPTSGGPFVGTLPADSPLVELARNPKDPEDAEFIVIASAKIGINAFSILDEAGLKRLQLSREDVVNLVRDTKWHDLIQYEVNAGRRWFMIVVGELGGSGRDEDEKSGGEASSEIRAVVGDDETFLGSASSGGEGGKGSTVEQNRVDDLAEMMRKVQEVLFGGQEGDEERRRFRERWLEEVARATRMEIEKAAGSEEKDGDSGKSEGDEEARGTASSGDQTKGEAAEAAEPREKDAPGEGSKEEFFRDEL